jgi:hypothetical protein
MSQNCTDRGRLDAWCESLPGSDRDERRSELLWQYATGKVESAQATQIAAHLETCPACREALDAERLLVAARSNQKTVLARCPSSEEVLDYLERNPAQSPWRRLEIKMHVDRCELCREEASWAASHVTSSQTSSPSRERQGAVWLPWKWIAAPIAALLVLAAVLLYPTTFGPKRYAHLARIPDMPYEAVVAEFASAHPDAAPRFRTAAEHIQLGDYDQGAAVLGELEQRFASDPSIHFFRGYIAVREGRWEEATLLCKTSERSSMDGFRCWYLANVALKAGELTLARKEIRHALGHAPYAKAAHRLEQQVH